MDALRKSVIEEIAFEGPRGLSWPKLVERLTARSAADSSLIVSLRNVEKVKSELISNDVIEAENNDNFTLVDDGLRLQILGVSHLPVVIDNPQSLRILEYVARGRSGGAWSFHLCAALKVDPKQLFHLSNVLVEFRVVNRFSNVTVPRNLKSQTTASSASFFILSRFSTSSDPEIADAVDPANSTENVCSLILTLLREAGGVMLSKPLRTAVVVEGGFTGKQYRRGRDRLSFLRRVELFQVPKSDSHNDHDNDDEDNDEEEKSFDYMQAVRLVEAHELVASPVIDETVKEEDESEEEVVCVDDESLFKSIRVKNALRSTLSFRSSILAIIAAGGDPGVTTRDISRLTGVGSKEILKAMESLRTSIETVWKNDGKRKYIVYKPARELTISITDDSTPSPPSSGKGYVTDQTVRRTVIAADIVSVRGALSLIDLGRAIEQAELSAGTGIPGMSIDRRTLKKICDIAKIPLVEKGNVSTSKIVIAYDSSQMDATEAMRRIDRPVGITPKSSPSSSTVIKKQSVLPSKRLSIPELVARGRLAAIAILGPSSGNNRKPAVSYSIAENYGMIRSRDIFISKLLHSFIVSKFAPGQSVLLQEMIDAMPLVLYLQVIGCGVVCRYIDEFFVHAGSASIRVQDLPSDVLEHLRLSVPSPANVISITPIKQLARMLVPLVKLGLLSFLPPLYRVEQCEDDYWQNLYRQCMHAAHAHTPLPSHLAGIPQLMKKNQWKGKVIVPISHRKVLESFLRRLVAAADAEGYTSVAPLVVDGSHSELQVACSQIGMDPGSALKVLRHLYSLMVPGNSGIGNVIFASVNQARFSCPHCGQLFFQLASIQRHIQSVHAQPVPDDITSFTRSEYLDAISRLRSFRALSSEKTKKRRRRKTRPQPDSEHGNMTAVEIVELTSAHALATSLVSSPGENTVWKIMIQILGLTDSPETVKVRTMVALQQRSSVKAGRMNPESVVSVKTSTRGQNLAVLLVLNKFLESDISMVESLCPQMTDVLCVWHKQGLLAIERKMKGMNKNEYCLSRNGKIQLFGKFSEIEKFLSILLEFIECEKNDSVEHEVLHDSVVNAVLLDHTDTLYPEFEDDLITQTEEIEDDEFTGVKRHLELAGTVTIDRVHIAAASLSENVYRDKFIRELARLNQSSLSNVWRPDRSSSVQKPIIHDTISVPTELDIDIKAFERELGTGDVLGGVTVSRPEYDSNLLNIIGRKSLKFFAKFAPPSVLRNFGWNAPCPPVCLTSWTSFDGQVRDHVLADLLIHCMYLVYAHPGIPVEGITDRLGIIPQHEVELLIDPIIKFGLVHKGDNGSLFLTPINQW